MVTTLWKTQLQDGTFNETLNQACSLLTLELLDMLLLLEIYKKLRCEEEF